ncbi:MAG TPA: oligosaccharide flippase family protein [Gemmatimonadaceae bacterium]|nr:oligosaccharide flippase family protein [Gemmatimonadaceae bacterium]
MTAPLARQAGAALLWKGAQLFGSRAVSLARYLVLARLLVPDDFGLFAVALVPLDVLLSVSNLGMIPALVQRDASDDRTYDTAWTLGLLRAVAISASLLIAAPLLAALFAEPRATGVLRLLALQPLISASASIKVADLERRLEFRPLTMIEVPATAAGAIASIVLAPLLGVFALVAGVLVGSTVRSALSYILAPHRPRLVLDIALARSLFRFGRWVFLTGLVAVGGDAVLRAVISRRLGAAELGLYFLASHLAALPNDVVSELMVSVAFPVHARVQADLRRVGRVFRATVTAMATVLCPVYALLIVLAPSVVQYLLGPRWAGAESVLPLLALAGILGISYDATAPMLEGRGEPHKVTALHAIISITVVLLVWKLAGAYGLAGAALAWVLAQSVMLIACVIFSRRILGHFGAGLAKPLAAILAASVAGGAVALALRDRLPGLIGFATTVMVASGVMTLLLWVLEARFDLGVGRDLTQVFPRIANGWRRAPRAG